MAYRIDLAEPISTEVRRVAREQLQSAIDEIDDRSIDRDKVVHLARKHCKRMRGLLRMIRPGCSEIFRSEDRFFRDSARGLSAARDQKVAHEAYSSLAKRYADEFNNGHRAVGEQLAKAAASAAGGDRRKRGLQKFRGRMLEALDRIEGWPLDLSRKTIVQGVAETYAKGRQAVRRVERKPTDERFHEWRKHAKYLWYQVRLLQDAWKEVFVPVAGQLDAIGNEVGDHHDLGLLAGMLAQESCARETDKLLDLIERRQSELASDALSRGCPLYAAKPKLFEANLKQLLKSAVRARQTKGRS